MLRLIFSHRTRRVTKMHQSVREARLLKELSSGKPQRVRISTSSVVRLKDDDLKNDPDVKSFMQGINKDFKDQVKSNENKVDMEDPRKSSGHEDNNQKEGLDSHENEKPSGKSISQLLSELYGTDVEKKETFSSIGGYKEYVDSDSTVIYDIDEEREIMRKAYLDGKPIQTDKKAKPSQAEKYSHLAHKRGERGVFDIEDLVDVLKDENVLDIAVITIPASRQYADYMLVGTARNSRHLRTVSSLIVSLYKKKRYPEDAVPKREGELDTNTGWTAMDMGNIVLHLLVQEKREYYDLETLWTVGADFDDNTRSLLAAEESNKINTLEDLMASTDVDLDELFGRKDTV